MRSSPLKLSNGKSIANSLKMELDLSRRAFTFQGFSQLCLTPNAPSTHNTHIHTRSCRECCLKLSDGQKAPTRSIRALPGQCIFPGCRIFWWDPNSVQTAHTRTQTHTRTCIPLGCLYRGSGSRGHCCFDRHCLLLSVEYQTICNEWS